jgi:glutamyl-Q tRNA(Asp) synthetase
MPNPAVFRFAPSPNGHLHLGHGLSALLNQDMAQACGGRLLLRVEDIDRARCRPDFETAIYEDLAWLGLDWEQPVRRQSEHFEAYRTALQRIDAMGLLYPGFDSRADIAGLVAQRDGQGSWPRDPDGTPLYPGTAKALSAAARRQRMASGEPYALRLDMAAALARIGSLSWTETGTGPDGETATVRARPEAWGDLVLARKETPTSYHLAVVVDDALQGVTQVVRGQDLFWSTSVHRVLQALLGLPTPLYHHHRLVCGDDGRKLSKSTKATALRELRARGVSASDVRRMVGLAATNRDAPGRIVAAGIVRRGDDQ